MTGKRCNILLQGFVMVALCCLVFGGVIMSATAETSLFDYEEAVPMEIQNGLVLFYTSAGYGYADLSGKVVIEPIYSIEDQDSRNIFSDGAYVFDGSHVMISDGVNRFVVDHKGYRTVFPHYDKIGLLKDGLVWLQKKQSSFSGGQTEMVGYFDGNGTPVIEYNETLKPSVDFYNGMLLFEDGWGLADICEQGIVFDMQGQRYELYVANVEDTAVITGLTADQIRDARVTVSAIKKGQKSGECFTPCSVLLKNRSNNETIAIIGAYIGQKGEVYCNRYKRSSEAPNLLSSGIAYGGDRVWHRVKSAGITRENFSAFFVNPQFDIVFTLENNQELWSALTLEGPDSCEFTPGFFNDGIVVATLSRWYKNGDEETYCFTLDMQGQFVMRPRSDISWGTNPQNAVYSSGLCPAQSKANGLWGYVNQQGDWQFPPVFLTASNFESGHAIVSLQYAPHQGVSGNKDVTLLIDAGGNVLYPSQNSLDKTLGDGQSFLAPLNLHFNGSLDTAVPAAYAAEAPNDSATNVSHASQKCYYNPNGGHFYHADPYCDSVNVDFLPLAGSFEYGELGNEPYNELQPCLKCKAPIEKNDMILSTNAEDLMTTVSPRRTSFSISIESYWYAPSLGLSFGMPEGWSASLMGESVNVFIDTAQIGTTEMQAYFRVAATPHTDIERSIHQLYTMMVQRIDKSYFADVNADLSTSPVAVEFLDGVGIIGECTYGSGVGGCFLIADINGTLYELEMLFPLDDKERYIETFEIFRSTMEY